MKIKCPWCGMDGTRDGTTTNYLCGSSVGCAHQIRSPACKEFARIGKVLSTAREQLAKIVVDEGEDAGVILLSWESPTHYDPTVGMQMYDHDYFSPLGDALVELARTLRGDSLAAGG